MYSDGISVPKPNNGLLDEAHRNRSRARYVETTPDELNAWLSNAVNDFLRTASTAKPNPQRCEWLTHATPRIRIFL